MQASARPRQGGREEEGASRSAGAQERKSARKREGSGQVVVGEEAGGEEVLEVGAEDEALELAARRCRGPLPPHVLVPLARRRSTMLPTDATIGRHLQGRRASDAIMSALRVAERWAEDEDARDA
eukprot:827050-Rhodomonas_salina.2